MGYETMLVGYREDDTLRFVADHGPSGPCVAAGRCGLCRRNVFVNQSGARAIRERDCGLVCRFCRAESSRLGEVMEAL